ncbi:BrnA antitoxin family protein [Terrarubrum flagellatum]|uniref:BrnA antitoxin family protein n=1 Tax=Terrirubrum flagellatum TaxID=2895980 RepID=UPI003145417D
MQSISRSQGRPCLDNAKQAVTLRVSPATLARFKASGKDWRAKMSAALDKAKAR